jgi:hypothetical protein
MASSAAAMADTVSGGGDIQRQYSVNSNTSATAIVHWRKNWRYFGLALHMLAYLVTAYVAPQSYTAIICLTF